jgi:hypothetical protein
MMAEEALRRLFVYLIMVAKTLSVGVSRTQVARVKGHAQK